MVLGPGNYSVTSLKAAIKEMDLNRNGSVNWYEFRAFMSANRGASKSAEHILSSEVSSQSFTPG